MNAYEITQLLLRESSFLSKLRETLYWTESTFDTAGRPWKTTTPDGAYVETTYSVATTGGNIGTAVTVKDQAGKLRRSITNSLGQLTRVDEPNVAGQLGASIDAPNQATIYSYDLLNNLTQVQQPGDNNEECGPSTTSCSQTRSFTYDSLSRLKQATNPESGTINYGYDLNGNLQTKTDARGIVTTYAYDALNRVKTRQYTNEPTGSETPDVSYYYDNVANAKGKLIKVASTVATTEYTSFDILGRVTASRQTTDGVAYGNGTTDSLMTYSYNLSGALIEQQYPSGRVVRNTLDANGDLMAVLGSKTTHPQFWAYATGFKYNAAGAVTSMQLGNGNWESTTFNSRLQPTQIALGTTQNATNLLDLDYTYGTTSNNGNVLSQTITVPTFGATPGFTAIQNYSYDSLNRLKQADEKPQGWTDTNCTTDPTKCWKQTFTFDRYGNRRFDEANTTVPGSFANPAVTNPTISPNTNKLTSTGYTFDAAGNTTRDALDRKFTYDAENKQTKVESLSPGTDTVTGTVGEYWYDGDGRRVKKYVPSTGETTIFVYDAASKLVAEYSTIVASGQDAKVAYLTNDHLGSPRINTEANGAVTARHDYHPFGEEIASSHRTAGLAFGDDTVRKQFTGYERDRESELDFAQARCYMTSLGRFSAPDDLLNDSSLGDPGSWNKYAFVRNSPLKLVDPSGEKARLTITTNKDKKTGTIVIEASFGVYGQEGDYSQKELQNQADALKAQIQETFKGGFVADGITYSVSASITTQVFKSEADAEQAGGSGKIDNIVGLRNSNSFQLNADGVTDVARGLSYNKAGENFDRMVVATGSGGLSLSKRNTYAHEFGHLMGSRGHSSADLSEGLMRPGQVARGHYLTAGDFARILLSPARTHVAGTGGPFRRNGRGPTLAIQRNLYDASTTQEVRGRTHQNVAIH